MSDDKDRADTPEARQRFDEFADSSPVFTAMVREMARLIAATAGAVNYIEYGLHSQETGLLSVTIRTEHGETPGQQCVRLKAELEAERAKHGPRLAPEHVDTMAVGVARRIFADFMVVSHDGNGLRGEHYTVREAELANCIAAAIRAALAALGEGKP